MHRIIRWQNTQWVDIQNPSNEDVQFLKQNFAFHPLVYEELIPQVWRTKVEIFPTHFFLVLHYPLYDKELKETKPQEIDIVVTKDTVVTSHYHSLVPIKSLLDKCNLYVESRKTYMNQGPGFLMFYILNELWESSLTKVNRIDMKLEAIEAAIFKGEEIKMLKEISFTKADIIEFLKIISPQGETLESLRKQASDFFGQELEPYLSHLIGHWNLAKTDLLTYKETVRAFEETNTALLTHKTNQTVQMLTMVSVFFLPLMLLVSLFGMNTTWLPFSNSPYDFWIIIGLMATITLGMVFYFKKKKWI